MRRREFITSVTVLTALGGKVTALAAKRATTTIPVVFISSMDCATAVRAKLKQRWDAEVN